jgi:uncharacterized integral membrane protein
MLSIVLAIILGIGFTLLALQNTGVVLLNLFGLMLQLPLYMIAGATFLAGILVAMVFHLFDMLSASLMLHQREGALKDVSGKNERLAHEVEALRLENTQLKERLGETKAEARDARIDEKKAQVKGFFGRVKESFS